MISYLKCPNCNGIISANDNDKIVQCATCGKKYVNPNFRDVNLSEAANAEQGAKCKVCGKNVSKEYEFCPFCGAQLKVRCSKCGNALREEDLFCPRCGTPKNKPVKNVGDESVETQEPCDNHVDAPIIVEDAKTENDVFKFAEAAESKPVSVAANNRPHKKYGKKAVQAVVKNAICLVLAIMLFAFAFCPIIKSRYYSSYYYIDNIEVSGIDYIAIMGATNKKYNTEDDAEKLEKIAEELKDIQKEMTKSDYSYTKKQNGDIVNGAEYKRLKHKYFVGVLKYSMSQEDSADTFDAGKVIATGVLSLFYIFVSGAAMVLSGIALVFSIINLKRADDKKLRYWSGYQGLFVVLLFLSIAIIFASTVYISYTIDVIALTMIFRLLFECIAVAFVMADLCTAQDNAERRQGIFKAAAIVLCVIIAGVCFAPSFRSVTKVETSVTTDDGGSTEKNYEMDELNSAWVFGATQVGKAEYEDSYKYSNHDGYLSALKNYIENSARYDRMSEIVRNVYFDKFTYNDAKELANGYYLLLAVIVIAGLCGCLSAMSGKVIDTIRKIAQPLLVLLVVVVLVFGAVMVKTVNEYMSTNDISNFKMAMDCGIILALVFAVALCVCEYVPAMIEKGKNKATPMQAQF